MPEEGDGEPFGGRKEGGAVPEVRESVKAAKRQVRGVLGLHELPGLQVHEEYPLE